MAYQLNINWPEFLEKYWQKQPVVLKNAFPDFVDPITPDELAGLAMEPEVDSRLVSLTNGDAGHHEMGGAPLAWRRRTEAAAAGKVLGVEYITLDIHDGTLLPTIENRHQGIALVREFQEELGAVVEPLRL